VDEDRDPIEATIAYVETFHAFADDACGVRYFLYSNAFETTGQYGFAHLRPGTRVRFTPIVHPRGPRGIGVRILTR